VIISTISRAGSGEWGILPIRRFKIAPAVRHKFRGDGTMMNSQVPLKPDELFRQYRRGMLDPDSINTQIMLNLIELAERQEAIAALLEMAAETWGDLDLDIEVIARHLQLPRPSKLGTDHPQNGTTGPDQAGEDESDED
jgi:hypothetical protein